MSKIGDPRTSAGTGCEPWFQRTGVRSMKPISPEGRRANFILFGGMLAAIPAGLGLVLLAGNPVLMFVPLFVGFVAVPAWFLWSVRGRIRL